MKKAMLVAIMLVLFTGPVMAAGGLDSFLNNLNIQARADMQGFSVKLSAQFGVPLPQVQAVITTASAPADAFMCFQLGYMTRTPYEKAVQVYQGNRGKGWGVIALGNLYLFSVSMMPLFVIVIYLLKNVIYPLRPPLCPPYCFR